MTSPNKALEPTRRSALGWPRVRGREPNQGACLMSRLTARIRLMRRAVSRCLVRGEMRLRQESGMAWFATRPLNSIGIRAGDRSHEHFSDGNSVGIEGIPSGLGAKTNRRRIQRCPLCCNPLMRNPVGIRWIVVRYRRRSLPGRLGFTGVSCLVSPRMRHGETARLNCPMRAVRRDARRGARGVFRRFLEAISQIPSKAFWFFLCFVARRLQIAADWLLKPLENIGHTGRSLRGKRLRSPCVSHRE